MKCQDHAWCDVASNRALRFAKNSLTSRGNAPNKLLNLLEQLLQKIKANRKKKNFLAKRDGTRCTSWGKSGKEMLSKYFFAVRLVQI